MEQQQQMHFVVLNDSRHMVPDKIREQYPAATITILTDANYPSFESKDNVVDFAWSLAKKITTGSIVVLTGTIEVAMLIFTMVLRRDSYVRYASFDFTSKKYNIRKIEYLELR